MHRVVAQLKRRLKTQGQESRGHARHAHVDVRRTMRASLQTGGVPVELRFKPRAPAAAGDLRPVRRLDERHERVGLLPLACCTRCTTRFARCARSSSSSASARSPTSSTASATSARCRRRSARDAGVADVSGYTDYGRVWSEFRALVEDDLHPRATVIVLGDARTNGRDPRADIFAADRRARRPHVLAEPRAAAVLELRRLGDRDLRAALPGVRVLDDGPARGLRQGADAARPRRLTRQPRAPRLGSRSTGHDRSRHAGSPHHPLPRRPADRARPVSPRGPGRQPDRRRPRDDRAVSLRQVAHAAVLRRHAQARALPRAERRAESRPRPRLRRAAPRRSGGERLDSSPRSELLAALPRRRAGGARSARRARRAPPRPTGCRRSSSGCWRARPPARSTAATASWIASAMHVLVEERRRALAAAQPPQAVRVAAVGHRGLHLEQREVADDRAAPAPVQAEQRHEVDGRQRDARQVVDVGAVARVEAELVHRVGEQLGVDALGIAAAVLVGLDLHQRAPSARRTCAAAPTSAGRPP